MGRRVGRYRRNTRRRTDSSIKSERTVCVAEMYSATVPKSNQRKNPQRFRGSLRTASFENESHPLIRVSGKRVGGLQLEGVHLSRSVGCVPSASGRIHHRRGEGVLHLPEQQVLAESVPLKHQEGLRRKGRGRLLHLPIRGEVCVSVQQEVRYLIAEPLGLEPQTESRNCRQGC